MTPEDLANAWNTNNRINLLLVDEIDRAGLTASLSKRGGRDVGRQFAHLHDVRVAQLEARAPDLAKGLAKFSSKAKPLTKSPTKAQLKKALTASGKRVETFLRELATGTPKRRGFKKGLATTLAYFIAHESHHRGNITLTLKQNGHGVGNASQYGIWDWDRL